MLAACRDFFAVRDVLEVETPILSRAGATDPNIQSLRLADDSGPARFLNTSPEFAMKRLIAAGAGDIFQIARAFREGERGRLHNPEFSLLEWYRGGFAIVDLMKEVAALLGVLLKRPEVAEQAVFLSYGALFEEHLNLNPHAADVKALQVCLDNSQVAIPQGENDKDVLLDLIMSSVLLPALDAERLCFIYDYPISQAALAKAHPQNPQLARRFEAIMGGMELANGFEELDDPLEQRARFESDRRRRAETGAPQMPIDEFLLAALAQGLGECSGVAVGLDRVLMLAINASHIDEVLSFPVTRC